MEPDAGTKRENRALTLLVQISQARPNIQPPDLGFEQICLLGPVLLGQLLISTTKRGKEEKQQRSAKVFDCPRSSSLPSESGNKIVAQGEQQKSDKCCEAKVADRHQMTGDTRSVPRKMSDSSNRKKKTSRRRERGEQKKRTRVVGEWSSAETARGGGETRRKNAARTARRRIGG